MLHFLEWETNPQSIAFTVARLCPLRHKWLHIFYIIICVYCISKDTGILPVYSNHINLNSLNKINVTKLHHLGFSYQLEAEAIEQQ